MPLSDSTAVRLEGGRAGHLGQSVEHQGSLVVRVETDLDPVEGQVVAHTGVDVGAQLHADLPQRLSEGVAGELGGAVEQHVLDEVRDAQLIVGLVDRADVDEQPHREVPAWAVVGSQVVGEAVVEGPDGHGRVDRQRGGIVGGHRFGRVNQPERPGQERGHLAPGHIALRAVEGPVAVAPGCDSCGRELVDVVGEDVIGRDVRESGPHSRVQIEGSEPGTQLLGRGRRDRRDRNRSGSVSHPSTIPRSAARSACRDHQTLASTSVKRDDSAAGGLARSRTLTSQTVNSQREMSHSGRVRRCPRSRCGTTRPLPN